MRNSPEEMRCPVGKSGGDMVAGWCGRARRGERISTAKCDSVQPGVMRDPVKPDVWGSPV